MKTYELRGDWELASLNLVDGELISLLNHVVHDGAVIDRNVPIELEVGNFESKGDWIETDFPELGAAGAVVFSDWSTAAFETMLTDAGYFIDARVPAHKAYKIFICERVIDALDQQRSSLTRFSDGDVWDVMRYELRPELLHGMDVFRLEHRRARLFVSDRFKAVAGSYGLTGFVFQEIWSSETGGVTLPPDEIPIEHEPGSFARRAASKRQALRAELARRAQRPL